MSSEYWNFTPFPSLREFFYGNLNSKILESVLSVIAVVAVAADGDGKDAVLLLLLLWIVMLNNLFCFPYSFICACVCVFIFLANVIFYTLFCVASVEEAFPKCFLLFLIRFYIHFSYFFNTVYYCCHFVGILR